MIGFFYRLNVLKKRYSWIFGLKLHSFLMVIEHVVKPFLIHKPKHFNLGGVSFGHLVDKCFPILFYQNLIKINIGFLYFLVCGCFFAKVLSMNLAKSFFTLGRTDSTNKKKPDIS